MNRECENNSIYRNGMIMTGICHAGSVNGIAMPFEPHTVRHTRSASCLAL